MLDSGILQFNVIQSFSGSFDGCGHSIANLTYSDELKGGGLFSYVSGDQAEIKNVVLIEPDIRCSSGGALVATLDHGTMENCGVIGGRIVGVSDVGGLIGYVGNYYDCPSIIRCFSTAQVSGDDFIGGLIGQINNGNIYDSYARGNVTATSSDVGGLVGFIYDGMISDCYSTGVVSGTSAGGLVGPRGIRRRVFYSFWDKEASGQPDSNGGSGKTTAEMKNANTFLDAGWDFSGEVANGEDNTWTICEGTNYPRLSWQIPTADIACPDGVTEKDFSFFAEHWWSSDCTVINDYCGGADFDRSGQVDGKDFAIFADQWLEGVE
jgi:hypothetical protein